MKDILNKTQFETFKKMYKQRKGKSYDKEALKNN